MKSTRAKQTMDFHWILTATLVIGLAMANKTMDTREGEDVTLKCRFNEHFSDREYSYYWAQQSPNKYDNVAIKSDTFNPNYKIDYRPNQGIYDLQIFNVSYVRDNGRFECRIKQIGSDNTIYEDYYNLTVLTPPQPPLIFPGSETTATEDKKLELTCSSVGGSPDPTISWHREASTTPLMANQLYGGSRDMQTTSTLTIIPRREDDGATFTCVVWNRALPEGQRLETVTTLSVNYYPRVEIGPENPLSVERDQTAKLECNIDAKPKPETVKWTRNGRFISSHPTHTIHRVSLQDAGRYTCSADNGLGKIGEQEITLNVLYSPIVQIETKAKTAEEKETVHIKCNVTSNPPPVTIEWLKEGDIDFRRSGDTLVLRDVRAENAGTYVCRGINMMKPYGGKTLEREGNASVVLLVRHRPGRAKITPENPVVHVGNSVSLMCKADPPGYPDPQYRWYRDVGGEISTTVIAQGAQYLIPKAGLSSEGKYHCHASNELGNGDMASATLEIHQPPQFLAKLQSNMIKRAGETDFFVTCSAKGKPEPTITWFKDDVELTPELLRYEVKTNVDRGPNGMITVQSMLKFAGKARPNGNDLTSTDRGQYTCLYENEVNKANSTMQLKIEHEPIVLHQYNKVANDIKETAEVLCKVQSYPKPEFLWQFGTNLLSAGGSGHYEIVTTADGNDIYTSVLKIGNVRHQDYGEYHCRVSNPLNTIQVPIRLQPKGPPEKPTTLKAVELGSNFVILSWSPGFDGGLANTKYFVSYRKIVIPNESLVTEECAAVAASGAEWMEFDCQREIPCTINPLDRHQSYIFKVKALNTKGVSEHSNEVTATTKVENVPIPLNAAFDPETKVLTLKIAATCLSMVAIVESVLYGDTPMAAWHIIEKIDLLVDGHEPTYRETEIKHFVANRRSNGRSLGINSLEDIPLPIEDELNPRVRVKLCLKINHEYCGDYLEADIGPSLVQEASFVEVPTLIAIIVTSIVAGLCAILLVMFCRCKRRNQMKESSVKSKEYDIDSIHPSIVAQQNQAPPPYYSASSLENKALEHSMDLAMDSNTALYASQQTYGYHQQNAIVPQMPQNDWSNMGYVENSYSNSNNGGSVNSQDSIWQLKMSAAASNSANLIPQHNYLEQQIQPNYGYDPMTHGGYGAVDDYAPYPHMMTATGNSSQHGGDDYHHNLRNSQNPSRQDYCSDPYASVHKPKKRLDQHMDFVAESPYHDVSGLPDPYMEQDEAKSPVQNQHLSLSYDDALAMESGYSTPNSRNRRVIHEIVV
ncbi:hemicentin-1-like [Anopheles darlingi]|nr:hemicentin-1-like [Anopheles darlingi]XP_049534632.1 hemicentin-1-like [Anopheles darlingi]XP_049534633.1 hemicentin-1-like [Anopheles darlingi]XP_049534634.1 hemicentin-1-like [Anopheles darlingi]